jgi:glucose-6-phosphate 1-dehydrogenase
MNTSESVHDINIPSPVLRARDPLTITIFGATGDLTQRKLMPALFVMFEQGFLPAETAIVGFARREYTDESFRVFMGDAVKKFSRIKPSDEQLAKFLQKVFYHRGDIDDVNSFKGYAPKLADTAKFPPNHLYYLSIKPEQFETALASMHNAGLIGAARHKNWTRVVIEKPFGRDLPSAIELNRTVGKYLDESQVYRIDHYLGKETVQNILSFRFANAIFEPLFQNHLVDHIQITAAETVGMESGRGAYYDSTGALRDMMQNHILQLMCLVTMEPPASLTADAIRNEKVKVLQSIVPPKPDQVAKMAVRGQYTGGLLGDVKVPGYLEEDRINPKSMTETFAALKLNIQNWRWNGVPVFLRTGKRLHRRVSEIVIQFKTPPLELFHHVECIGDVCDLTRAKPNQIIFRIQPDEGIALKFSAKRPALQVQVENVSMNFSYSQTWQKDLPEAYERLLLDVMRGDSTLFTRSDEVAAAWSIIDPILQSWSDSLSIPMATYAPGSWGPAEANHLIKGHPEGWRKPA